MNGLKYFSLSSRHPYLLSSIFLDVISYVFTKVFRSIHQCGGYSSRADAELPIASASCDKISFECHAWFP